MIKTRQEEIIEMETVVAKRRRLWVMGLKGIWTANVIWQVVNLIAVIVDINRGKSGEATVSKLLDDNIYLMLRICGYVSTMIFLIAGIVINYQMKALINQDRVKYDEKLKEAQ